MHNKTEIIIFHLIYFGAISKNIEWDSIINWIEKKFNENCNTDIFIDLVTTNDSKKILEKIANKIELNFNDEEIRNLILSFYNEFIKQYPENIDYIEKDLVDFFNLINYENSNQKYDDFLFEINENYSLKKDGFTGNINLKKYLTKKLEPFKEYSKLLQILRENSLVGYQI